MTDYEKEYQNAAEVCGQPFEEIVSFFGDYELESAVVLDLGCGQGRDALVAARRGHRVIGVDIAPTGVSQMIDQAEAEGLLVEGHVADIANFHPPGEYDVVILDRVLHMLGDDATRRSVLTVACDHTRSGGYVLIADTPSNIPMIDRFLQERERWSIVYSDRNFRFARNSALVGA